MKNRFFLGFVVAMVVVATSCGKMPQDDINATKAAVEAARLLRPVFTWLLNSSLYRIR